jgi:hypothetical protein
VVTRKYIIPEVDAPSSETDIVVLNPSYPEPLQDRHEILFGDVAAAFSVKLTLNSAGIRDGVSRAVQLRRGMGKRFGSPREEMLAPFPVGLLAHSHSWRSPGSTPRDNITQQLRSLDDELAEHPRESLDYVCVADLGFWWTMRTPFLPAGPAGMLSTALTGKPAGVALSGIGQTEESEIYAPVASLITQLLARMSYNDPTLRPLATSFRVMGTLGQTQGKSRAWPLEEVYSAGAQAQLPQILRQGYDFWESVLY